MRRKFRALEAVAVVAVAVLFLALSLTAPVQAKGKGPKSGGTFSTPCGGGTVSISPSNLFPPNHTMHGEVVTLDDSSVEGSTLTLTIDSITDDQVEGPGEGCGPNQSTDWEPTALPTSVSGPADLLSTNISLRAERCANKDNQGGSRTYTIDVTCENMPPEPSPTTTNVPTPTPTPIIGNAELQVTVPHSMGH